MTEARTWPSATLLSDGRVLVVGGSGDGCLASAELYDPTTGSWTATGSLGSPRGGYTATAAVRWPRARGGRPGRRRRVRPALRFS